MVIHSEKRLHDGGKSRTFAAVNLTRDEATPKRHASDTCLRITPEPLQKTHIHSTRITVSHLIYICIRVAPLRWSGSMAKLHVRDDPPRRRHTAGPRGKTNNMKFQKIIFILATILSLTTTTALAQNKGKASYYGNKFHGRRTSDGSRYHKDSLTCAHRTLPFGTLIKVRNQKNGREVVVKVTDRGPFGPGRIVDLSMAAAREIGMVQQGVVPVEVTRVGHVNDKTLLMAQHDADHETALPQAKYLDPATGKFYTMDEWTERGEQARKEHMARMAKKVQPRYRVLTDKMTAKNISLPKQGH